MGDTRIAARMLKRVRPGPAAVNVREMFVGTATINGRRLSVFTTALAPLVLESAEYLA